MSLSIYRKYRPQTFSDVIGQKAIVRTLSNAIQRDLIGHAYLFTGPRGTGKTTLARIFAKTLNCSKRKNSTPCLKCENCKAITAGNSINVIEIDAASNTGVDNIRELRQEVRTPPSNAPFKIYIIDEVHMLSTGAFNALLKTLEEPPSHALFILATTEVHKVPETIISRCQKFDFTRLSLSEIVGKLSVIAKKEKISIDKDALEMIAVSAEGGMRDAESLFSQVLSMSDKKVTAETVQNILGISSQETVRQMTLSLANKKTESCMHLVSEVVQNGTDITSFIHSLIHTFRQLLLYAVHSESGRDTMEIFPADRKLFEEVTPTVNVRWIVLSLNHLNTAQQQTKTAFIPQLPLEIAIVKITQDAGAPNSGGESQDSVNSSPSPKTESAPETQPRKTSPTPPNQATKQASTTQEEITNAKGSKTTSSSVVEINDVTRSWKTLLGKAKEVNPSLGLLLSGCKPLDIEKGNTAIISTKFLLHKSKLNEQTTRLTVEDIFSTILETSIRVRFISEQEMGLRDPDSEKEVFVLQQEKEDSPTKNNEIIKHAMDIFGGEAVAEG